jgi:hypothetical protein
MDQQPTVPPSPNPVPTPPPQPEVQPPVQPVQSVPPVQPILPPTPLPAPPPKSKKGLLIIIVLVVLAAAGSAAWFMWPKGNAPGQANQTGGDKNIGSLLAGNFNYLNVCDVFTAADLDKATGQTSNTQEVGTIYAEKTYKDNDPQRTYLSECQRFTPAGKLGSDYVTVTLYQFSDSAVQDKAHRLQSTRKVGKQPDSELAGTFGNDATFVSHALYFTVDNKDVSVKTYFLGNASKEKAVAIAVGKAVKAKISELSANPSSVLEHSGNGQKVGSFAYRNSCDLVRPEDYRTILKQEPDEARIQTTFSEGIQKLEKSLALRSKCVIQNMPAKTELDSGNVTTDRKNTYITVDTDQYTTAEDAKFIFNLRTNDSQKISGIGDDANLRETDGILGKVRLLQILKGNTINRIEITRADAKNAGSDSGDAALLQQLGKALVGRL